MFIHKFAPIYVYSSQIYFLNFRNWKLAIAINHWKHKLFLQYWCLWKENYNDQLQNILASNLYNRRFQGKDPSN